MMYRLSANWEVLVTGQRAPRRITIIGGGASGSIAAISALGLPTNGVEITVIEKRPEIGRGLAYSTTLPDHRLNVRASNMSVFADDPSHFNRWLYERGERTSDFDHFFAPRGSYGEYIGATLRDAAAASSASLRVVADTAVSVEDRENHVAVGLGNGTTLDVDVAVLAIGHEEGTSPGRPYAVKIGSEDDTELDPEAPVMILGTGLSMADAWLTLRHRGHRGPVIALSRRGLTPFGHQGHKPLKLDRADVPFGTSLTHFVRWFRNLIRESEENGWDWRDVVDGLRPFNQEIWRNWSLDAKRRFFEHTKAWWDIHRHRMAPSIRYRVLRASAEGGLRVIAARTLSVDPGAQHRWSVEFRHRHKGVTERVEVERIYDCQGIISDLSSGTNPLMLSMISSGIARPDPLRISLDVSQDCAVMDGGGKASSRIFAVGPPTRGAFLEIDAIPDIRVQANALMRRLLESNLDR